MKVLASIDVSNPRVEDKQIELAITNDSTLLTDLALMIRIVVRVQVQIKNGLGKMQLIVGLQLKILMLQQVMNTKLQAQVY